MRHFSSTYFAERLCEDMKGRLILITQFYDKSYHGNLMCLWPPYIMNVLGKHKSK